MLLKKLSLAFLLVLSILVLTACNPFSGNTSSGGFGTVWGFIREGTDNSRLIKQEVQVSIGDKSSVFTDGNYSFRDIPVGTHTLKVVADGYEPLQLDVVVQKGVVTLADVVLQPSVTSQINRDLDIMNKALEARSIDMLMDAHTKDATYELVVGNRTFVLTSEDIRDAWEQTLSDPEFDEKFDVQKPFIRIDDEDILETSSESVVTRFREGVQGTDGVLTLKQEEGKWKIWRYRVGADD